MTFARRRYGKDNYLYLVAEGEDAALVDPGEPETALELCASLGLRPRAILHTHGHADHTGGSDELRRALGARVYGHGADAPYFRPELDLAGRDELAIGALRLGLLHVPGHTPGSLFLSAGRLLFTGDTLFWGGCGNCRHGGDPVRLARSFAGPIDGLEGDWLLHPGHDYAEPNLAFALQLEPENDAARLRLDEVRRARAEGREPEPSSLEQERGVNPFLRVEALLPALRERGMACASREEAFLSLRALRDRA